MLLLLLLVLVFLCESGGVTHWRIQEELIKAVNVNTVITAHQLSDTRDKDEEGKEVIVYDKELSILIKSVHTNKQATWVPLNRISSTLGSECPSAGDRSLRLKITDPRNPSSNRCHVVKRVEPPCTDSSNCKMMSPPNLKKMGVGGLSCGDPVDATDYDFLEGIANRKELPSHPEPEVASVFKKSDSDTSVDLVEVEQSLKMAVQEMALSPSLLRRIADYWRVKGETMKAIECLRTALDIQPDDPETLLAMARTLFNQKFFENAIYLTKRSMHFSEDPGTFWRHYYVLAEANKQLHKFEESAAFFKKSLELNPGLHIAELRLKEMGRDSGSVTSAYTVVIITTLISAVLGIVYYLICAVRRTDTPTGKEV